MSTTQSPKGPIWFGIFRLDAHTGELRKDGARIKLQEQPLLILQVLLERPGELVTREELRERVWPADTFVDFDKGLYSSIKKLREALGDDALAPRYIETVPKRGYRFIAPIAKAAEGPEAAQSAPEPSARTNGLSPSWNVTIRRRLGALSKSPLGSASEVLVSPERRSRARTLLAVFLIVAAAGGLGRWLWRTTKAPKEPENIVLADFANNTGDPVFDGTLQTALSISLRQSPTLSLLSENTISEILKEMTLPVHSKLGPEVARELCKRSGGQAYVAGAISNLGRDYILSLKAIECESGDVLAEVQVSAAAKEKVLGALGDAASGLRRELGESLVSVKKLNVPLERATTSSLEALRAYTLGERASEENAKLQESLGYYQRAIDLDPNFAMAYRSLGVTYFAAHEIDLGREYYRKAFQLREHSSEHENLVITGTYYHDVTGELNKAALIYRQIIESYPRDAAALNRLAVIYSAQGLHEQAVQSSLRSLQLDPDDAASYEFAALELIATQRTDEAQGVLRKAKAMHRLDEDVAHTALYAMGFMAPDSAVMAEQEHWLRTNPDAEDYGLALVADSEGFAGHLREARSLTEKSVNSAIRSGHKDSGALWRENGALREAAFGNFLEARRDAAAGLLLDANNPGVQEEAALAYAMAGDNGHARALIEQLDKQYPLDTQLQSLWLPAIRAQVALNRKNPIDAVNQLHYALPPIEYGGIAFLINISPLYHTYLRGEAYLAAGQGAASVDEFRKIIDHSGIVWNCWTGVLARLGLARADALELGTLRGADADAAKQTALAAYQDFLTLWKNADPDVPIFKQAKAEFAKLQALPHVLSR